MEISQTGGSQFGHYRYVTDYKRSNTRVFLFNAFTENSIWFGTKATKPLYVIVGP